MSKSAQSDLFISHVIYKSRFSLGITRLYHTLAVHRCSHGLDGGFTRFISKTLFKSPGISPFLYLANTIQF